MKFRSFTDAIDYQQTRLLMLGAETDTGHWQGVPTEGKPDLQTMECLDVQFSVPMPLNEYAQDAGLEVLRKEVQPNLPWADDHFEERVSRVPSNPGEQYLNWPWWSGQDKETRATGKFTHTYQERYWPKHANDPWYPDGEGSGSNVQRGIRYRYGDLDDLVSLLLREPYTRQAWLPIFFPEDTGAVHGGRVPCTLGYQFMLRDNRLHMWYIIRSCDFVRHFRDDLYLSARLLLWVLNELQVEGNPWSDVEPGIFHFHCFSLHYHRGDEHLLRGP